MVKFSSRRGRVIGSALGTVLCLGIVATIGRAHLFRPHGSDAALQDGPDLFHGWLDCEIADSPITRTHVRSVLRARGIPFDGGKFGSIGISRDFFWVPIGEAARATRILRAEAERGRMVVQLDGRTYGSASLKRETELYEDGCSYQELVRKTSNPLVRAALEHAYACGSIKSNWRMIRHCDIRRYFLNGDQWTPGRSVLLTVKTPPHDDVWYVQVDSWWEAGDIRARGWLEPASGPQPRLPAG